MSQQSTDMNEFRNSIAAYGRHLATSFGGVVEEWEGVLLCDARLAWRSRNMVVPLRPLDGETRRRLAERLLDFYGARDSWVLWATMPLELDANDFRLAESNTVMVERPENVSGARDVSDLTIEEVTDDDGVRLFEQIRQTADKFPPAYDSTPGRFFDARVLSDVHRLWIGTIDGQAVATAASFVHGDVNLIKNVSTAETHAGRGIGQAMSQHAIRSSTKRSVLDGSAAGVPVYRKLGFEPIGQVDFWVMTWATAQ